jgi:uncharacterized membrane protein YgcG
MRRIVPALVALLCSLGASPSTLPAQPPIGSLSWDSLVVRALLDRDGRLHVEEQQAMNFTGDWNGGERIFNVRPGQRLTLDALWRVEPDGKLLPLRKGPLTARDEYAWEDGHTLRWRSRLPSDPPFDHTRLTYRIEYTLAPVLRPTEGGYLLDHDFAFGKRDGVIDRFRLELDIDPAWGASAGQHVSREAGPLLPGEGYVVRLPLTWLDAGTPAAVPARPSRTTMIIPLAAALAVLVLMLGALRRARAAGRFLPLISPERIDRAWLDAHLLGYAPELAGAAWDRSVGSSEVAAMLARLVGGGKLESRVESHGRGKPVLHLRRIAELQEFTATEQSLLEGLFFDGGAETDTDRVREHYRNKGFDPAAKIRAALLAEVDQLPGAGRVRRSWAPGLVIFAIGVVISLLAIGRNGLFPPIGLAAVTLLFSVMTAAAVVYSRRVVNLAAPAVWVAVLAGVGTLMLVLVGIAPATLFPALVFFTPGALAVTGLAVAWVGAVMFALAFAPPSETPERLEVRRALAAARAYFRHELHQPAPRLEDAWYPYLLAFGLEAQAEKWFRAFGAEHAHGAAVVSSGGSQGTSASGWTGGGPVFGGGGGFGGGGAGRSWGAAVSGMAAGVAAPSSSGSSGGGSSGGGGGGGW